KEKVPWKEALFYAVDKEYYVDELELLLKTGVMFDTCDKDTQTLLMKVTRLHWNENRINIMELLQKYNLVDFEARDRRGRTVFFHAFSAEMLYEDWVFTKFLSKQVANIKEGYYLKDILNAA